MEDTPQSNAQLESIQHELSQETGPSSLNPNDPNNAVIAEKKAMESLFITLEERGVSSPKKLTEFEVYARLEEYGKRARRG